MEEIRAVYIPQFHRYLYANPNTGMWEWNKYCGTKMQSETADQIGKLPLCHGIDVLKFWEEAE